MSFDLLDYSAKESRKKQTFTLRIAIFLEADSSICEGTAITKLPTMHRGWTSASSLA